MGAPPGSRDATAKPRDLPPPQSSELPVSGGGSNALPGAADAGAPRLGQYQQAPKADPLALMGLDVQRRHLTRGLRLYSDRHFDSAKHELIAVPEHPLAKEVLGQIQTHESLFHARQLAFVLKALVQDSFQAGKFSETERLTLYRAVDQIEAELIADGKLDLNKAVVAAQKKFDAEQAAAWSRFAAAHQSEIAELAAAFLETDAGLLAEDVLYLANRYRDRKSYGTSWALAQLAAEHPTTEHRAKQLSDYLEGKRLSTEYLVSDLFDHGGSAMAIDLLALVPAVMAMRRLSTVGWMVRQSWRVRLPLTMLAGGAVHWGSSKAIMALSGYDGQILPRSLREFGGEFTSSTLQASLALFLANRKFMWGKPTAAKEALAATEGAEATTAVAKPGPAALRRMVSGGKFLLRSGWWTAKTGMKLATIGGLDLLAVQLPLHHFGVDGMTPQGLPQYAMRLFPKTRETRQAVAQNYAAHRLFRDYQKNSGATKKVSTAIPGLDPNLDLDLLLTQLDPGIEGDKRETVYAILAESAAAGKFGLNIRRWILNKKKLGELGAANKTFARQGIPLRYEKGDGLCITDSEAFPCSELAEDKPSAPTPP